MEKLTLHVVQEYFDNIGFKYSAQQLQNAVVCVLQLEMEFKKADRNDLVAYLYPFDEYGGIHSPS